MRVTIERLDPVAVQHHLTLLHGWLTHPRSSFWGMSSATPEDVLREYADPAGVSGNPYHQGWLGLVEDRPAFLMETYDSMHSPLKDCPELKPGDVGMHLLTAPPSGAPIHGYTRRVFAAVMAHCFATPTVGRVVVEPDVRNRPIKVLNAAAGFKVAREIALPDKRAALSFCTRSAFTNALPTLTDTTYASA